METKIEIKVKEWSSFFEVMLLKDGEFYYTLAKFYRFEEASDVETHGEQAQKDAEEYAAKKREFDWNLLKGTFE